MIEFRNEKKGHRTRFNRQAIESHWNDFTQRVEKALVITQPVTRATPDGLEKRYRRALA